jgi:ATP-dependent Lhr-like helicase
MSTSNPLSSFHPIVRQWFEHSFGEPSPPQRLGWPSISAGRNTLILAPTGSGKTLAAFLWGINHLVEQHLGEELQPGVRILYISPLKALNNDIERNLQAPLEGIKAEARRAAVHLPTLRTGVRTGDTPQAKRVAMVKHPPDILITTPESLYLMLTSKQARKIFRTVQYVIVDEIHSLCGNKRGVHLSLSLERLQLIAVQEFVRIGLSATQKPLETIAAFLGGLRWEKKKLVARPVNIVDAGRRKYMDLRVECAAPDFSLLPQESLWPLIFTELLGLIRTHRTTLIFVNNRRLAERVAAKLNEMVLGQENTFGLYAVPIKTSVDAATNGQTPEVLVQAYHGSMSRHAREAMEADLKAGKLRALVTTSALELGIDIGSIDLVVQVQSPKGIARGLQRVGRSGHLVSETSKGRIFPSYREDLVESAVVARAMMSHDVEPTVIPEHCLDVLAQQIVAMVSAEEWDVDDLYDVVRQSYCYRGLSRTLFAGVLQMLAGRYRHEAFRELHARISWDKMNNLLRALPGSARLAVTSGGTITDRGYFPVYLADRKTKVGEVDEEFVYESRTGDTFILGSSVWRIAELDAQRLVVTPAPGEPARMPFWRGEGLGRSYELGKSVGAFRREMSHRLDDADCLGWLQHEFPMDGRAAWNIQEYFKRQHEIAGTIPTDRVLVVESFRDEIGDPRVILHSSFGRRINGLLGLVVSRRVRESIGVEPQMLYNDNGVLLRLPDLDRLPHGLLDGITLRNAETIVLEEMLTSPLFGGQFRQNAARALLMPKTTPGKRTPLWLQRLRAGDLLQVARQFEDFPVVIETIREVLHDVLDFAHFKEVVSLIERGDIRVEEVRTEVPSPFAASLLFDFIAVYMYEWDQPREDRQSQYLAINRELLAEIVDLDSVQGMLRPEAILSVEEQLQRTAEGYHARSPEELVEMLLRLGDLSDEEIADRTSGGADSMLHTLKQDGRAVAHDFNGSMRWIAGEEKQLFANLHQEENLRQIVIRYLQYHGPTTTASLAGRYSVDRQRVQAILDDLAASRMVSHGRFISVDDGDERQWCYRPNLERIHRQTLGILRKEIQPCSLMEFTRFLQHWQHVATAARLQEASGLEHILSQLQGLSLPGELWERDIFRIRLTHYSSGVHTLTASGALIWTGAGNGRTRFVFRGEGSVFLTPGGDTDPVVETGPPHLVLEFLRENGASFFNDIRAGTGLSLNALNSAISSLFWGGLITNDVYAEIQHVKRTARMAEDAPLERIELLEPRRNPQRGRVMGAVRRAIRQVPGWTGRWSLVHTQRVLGGSVSLQEQAMRQANQLLERYGILARELYRREDLLPWASIASVLQVLEMRGEIRRGYFVEGLSGMQYARPDAVDMLRRLRSSGVGREEPVLVNSCDPANPHGSGIELASPRGAIRLARQPGNYVAFQNGAPILIIENYGTRMWTLAESTEAALHDVLKQFSAMIKLPAQLRPFRNIVVEHCDGIRPTQSPLEPVLKSLGFSRDRNQTMRYDGYA